MTQYSPSQLRAAVAAICPDIDAQVNSRKGYARDERALWYELSCCLLSSQVPYDLARAAADEIARRRSLIMGRCRTLDDVERELRCILSGRFIVDGKHRRYRFPNLRSEQLAQTWATITLHSGSLLDVVHQSADVRDVRDWLVSHAPGLGPKQASMFLRNIGATYNLAVLDRHVLTYMEAVGLDEPGVRIGGFEAYKAKEALLQTHALEFGYPVGLLDWAIWIVMRIAGQRRG